MTTTPAAIVMQAVRARMDLLGMTQAEVAKHAGVAQTTVSRWLNGQRVLDVNDLAALADALRIAPEKLLKGRSR